MNDLDKKLKESKESIPTTNISAYEMLEKAKGEEVKPTNKNKLFRNLLIGSSAFATVLIVGGVTLGQILKDRPGSSIIGDESVIRVSPEDPITPIKFIDSNDVIGKAAILAIEKTRNKEESKLLMRSSKYYEEEGSVGENDISENDSSEEVYHYPFATIKILAAKEYKINILENEKFDYSKMSEVTDRTGFGEMKMIISHFETYGEDGIINGGDFLITFSSSNGVYSCLSNSGNDYEEIFSSHKRIYESDLAKIFKPPYYGIMVNKSEGKVYFEKNEDHICRKEDFDMSFCFYFDTSDVFHAEEATFTIDEILS